jgi:hypothetical protein
MQQACNARVTIKTLLFWGDIVAIVEFLEGTSMLTWLRLMLNWPLGLARLVARRASSMLGPMPALAVTPVAASILALSADTIWSSSPSPVMSMKASSQEMGCTMLLVFFSSLYTCKSSSGAC